MSMQVAIQQQRRDVEQQDAHRIIMASMSQLDMRVHSLESQGARADRRAAELASLCQALTEEQRATTLRLERIEDYFRCNRGHSGSFRPSSPGRDFSSQVGMGSEELQRRLCHVERETCAASTKIQHLVSIVEEAQGRHHHRLRLLEDNVMTTPARSACALSGSLAAETLSARAASVVMPNDTLRRELSAAETRASESLRAAQQLLRRCEGGPSPRDSAAFPPRRRSPGRETSDDVGIDDFKRRLDRVGGFETPPDSGRRDRLPRSARRDGEARMEEALSSWATHQTFQEHRGAIEELYRRVTDLGQNLGPRADAVEARVQALAETVEDLCQRRDVYSSSSIDMRILDITKTVEELHRRFEKVPTHDQIASASKFDGTQLEDLRVMWDEMGKKTSRYENNLEQLRARFRDLATLDELRDLSRRTDEIARLDSVKEACIVELRSQIESLPTNDQIQQVTRLLQGQKSLTADVEELRSKISDISEHQSARNTSCTAVSAVHESILSQFELRFEARPTHEQLEEQITKLTESHVNRIDRLSRSMETYDELFKQIGITLDTIVPRQTRLQADPECNAQTLQVLSLESELNSQREKIKSLQVDVQGDALSSRLESLSRDVHAIGESNTDASVALHARIAEMSAARVEHAEAIADLQMQLKALQKMEVVAEERSKAELALHSENDVANHNDGNWNVAVEPSEFTIEFYNQFYNLHRTCEALHDVVDGRILLSLQTLEAQVPETLQKVERLMVDHSERFAKVEENDVRLNLMQTKLGACEQKVQDCMTWFETRLEKVTVSHMRRHLQEEVQRLLQELNASGLEQRLDLSLDAIEELNSQQQRTMLQVRGLTELLQDMAQDEFYNVVAAVTQESMQEKVEVAPIVEERIIDRRMTDPTPVLSADALQ